MEGERVLEAANIALGKGVVESAICKAKRLGVLVEVLRDRQRVSEVDQGNVVKVEIRLYM